MDPSTGKALKITAATCSASRAHVGNESNFDKLVKGYGWKPGTVWEFLPAEHDREGLAGDAGPLGLVRPAVDRDRRHDSPLGWRAAAKDIPARAFTTETADGAKVDLKGGYSPIDYHPRKSKLSAREGDFTLDAGEKIGEMQVYRATTTSNGSLNARAAGYTDVINLDFHSAEARIRDTIHDLAYREALSNVKKILNNKEFRDQFMRSFGPEEFQALHDWVLGVQNMTATDPRTRNFDKAMSYARQGIVITGIGYRISTVLKHGGGAAALKSLGYLGNGQGAKYFASHGAHGLRPHDGGHRGRQGEVRRDPHAPAADGPRLQAGQPLDVRGRGLAREERPFRPRNGRLVRRDLRGADGVGSV
jgi:hypothetical protein